MNSRNLEQFAVWARRELMKGCRERLNYVMAHEKDPEFAEHAGNISILKREAGDACIEKAAYTWFNRFVAFRFMDVRGFYSQRILSPEREDDPRPQLLADAAEGVYPRSLSPRERERVQKLMDGQLPSRDPQAECYRILFLSACRGVQKSLPFLFEEVNAPMELLLPDDLLSPQSVPAKLRAVMDEEACQNVEVIGWLFQFYISEKKADIMKQKGAVSAEDLPARTQLFTPEWIVRYLVENSLGRLWLEHHPESELADHMRYFLSSQTSVLSSQTSVLSSQSSVVSSQTSNSENWKLKTENSLDNWELKTENLDVEDIKFCDPACGSGHILVYAFELLTKIYEEEGYGKKEIPALILRNNLFGLELDTRAGQLAGMALFFKACIYEPSFFRRVTGANDEERESLEPQVAILENIRFSAEEQKDYSKIIGKTLITQDLWLLMRQFENAESLGSLIIPATANLDAIEAAIKDSGVMDDLLKINVNTKLKKLLRLARFLSPRYHVLVTNPPYLGNAYLSPDQKQYGADHFPNGKSDLFSMFFERGYDLTLPGGYMGYMSPYVWMFIQSYEGLRRKMIEQKHIVSLIQMEYSAFAEATVPLCTFVLQNSHSEQPGDYFRLTEFKGGMEVQNKKYLEAIENPNCGWFYRTKAENFSKIPGSPIAYWANSVIDAFCNAPKVSQLAIARSGLSTGNNDLFLRYWFEVPFSEIGFNYSNNNEYISNKKVYLPCNKGGEFRRWYGNNEYVINWLHPEKMHRPRTTYMHLYYQPAITWSVITSGKFNSRFYGKGFLFDHAAASMFMNNKNYEDYVLGFLNTIAAQEIMNIMNPTLNTGAEVVLKMPLLINEKSIYFKIVSEIVSNNKQFSKTDWDSFETSWDFVEHPLAKSEIRNQKSGESFQSSVLSSQKSDINSQTSNSDNWKLTTDNLEHATDNSRKLEDCWLAWQQECEERFQTLKANEEELNRIFIDIYGLQEELTPKVDEKDVTVRRADLGRECRSLVSYALGCAFGRYDPHKPGLQYAGGPDPERDKYPVYLSVLDDEYSESDAVRQVKQFLREVYGDKYYVENLHFLETGLGRDLRSYLRNDFYTDHLKIYQKRPIYWLFQSPKGSFQALIYLHRYSSGTVAAIRQAARDYYNRLAGRAEALKGVSETTSGAERRKAEKQLSAVQSAMSEVKTWERDVLAPLAEARIELDLDDGVKVNYAKFGDALAKIK